MRFLPALLLCSSLCFSQPAILPGTVTGGPPLWGALAAWGDSLTQGTINQIPYPQQLSTLASLPVFNGGVGGEGSTQIKNRMIAATGKYDNCVVIWSGRNNSFQPATVQSDIATMVAALTLSPKCYVVLSILNGAGEGIGTSVYNDIVSLNSALAATYQQHYVDIRAILVAAYNPAIPQDVIDHTDDIPPSSLRVDSIHLNTAGYAIVAQQVYAWFLARAGR